MSDEMKGDDSRPATKGDLRALLRAEFEPRDQRLDKLESALREVAKTVSGHSVLLRRIEERLPTPAEKQRLQASMDACIGEVMASRRERALRDKGFLEQQAALTDHELRLTRLERRDKPS